MQENVLSVLERENQRSFRKVVMINMELQTCKQKENDELCTSLNQKHSHNVQYTRFVDQNAPGHNNFCLYKTTVFLAVTICVHMFNNLLYIDRWAVIVLKKDAVSLILILSFVVSFRNTM